MEGGDGSQLTTLEKSLDASCVVFAGFSYNIIDRNEALCPSGNSSPSLSTQECSTYRRLGWYFRCVQIPVLRTPMGYAPTVGSLELWWAKQLQIF